MKRTPFPAAYCHIPDAGSADGSCCSHLVIGSCSKAWRGKWPALSHGLSRLTPTAPSRLRDLLPAPIAPAELPDLTRLLRFLGVLYPGGLHWLEKRIEDVRRGRARCTVVRHGVNPIAVAIDTPKGTRRSKLSTLYVHPFYRGRGLGTKLLDSVVDGWLLRGIDEAAMTVPSARLKEVSCLALPRGFMLASLERDRYGVGRDEGVLVWSQ